MAYLELKIVDNACINYQKRTLLMPFFINLLMIEAKLFPQSPYFASNVLRFGEEQDKLTKLLPESNNTILMSVILRFVILIKVYWLEMCERMYRLTQSGTWRRGVALMVATEDKGSSMKYNIIQNGFTHIQ